MKELVAGSMVTMYLVAALFFLRFWSRTQDSLFVYFAIAFAILAFQRLVLTLSDEVLETAHWAYGLRLLAFSLILVAIWNKNRKTA